MLCIKNFTSSWVLHFLNEDQKGNRMGYSIPMLKKITSLKWNKRTFIIIGDKLLIFLINQLEFTWCKLGENLLD